MPEINPVTKDQLFEKKIAENTGSDYNVGDISDVVPVTKDQALLKEIALNSAGQSGDITELEGKVTANASAIKATQDMISDAYDSTHTYNAGDYCIHENVLYKCNTASTTGTWDSSKWDATTITNEVSDLTTVVYRGYVNYVDVMSDGVKTYGQLLSDLFTTEVRLLVINHRLTAKIVIGDSIVASYTGRNTGDNKVFFGAAQWDQSGATIGGVALDNTSPSDCKWTYTDMNGVTNDLSDLVPGSGVHIRIYY